ncbi:MAG: hypothetical protein MPJ24_03310 [Pirellulaceae bacterium]|nr:hypothetical protein [Pirellulaceae bacterium]
MPSFKSLYLLSETSYFEELSTTRTKREAASFLESWLALWHPFLLKDSDHTPRLHGIDEPPPNEGSRVVIPYEERGLFDQAIADYALSYQRVANQVNRWKILAEFSIIPAPIDSPEAPLIDQFFALGFTYYQIQIMLWKLRYNNDLDESIFSEYLITAAQSFAKKEARQTANSLQKGFDLLSETKEHYFPEIAQIFETSFSLSDLTEETVQAESKLHNLFPKNNFALTHSQKSQLHRLAPSTDISEYTTESFSPLNQFLSPVDLSDVFSGIKASTTGSPTFLMSAGDPHPLFIKGLADTSVDYIFDFMTSGSPNQNHAYSQTIETQGGNVTLYRPILHDSLNSQTFLKLGVTLGNLLDMEYPPALFLARVYGHKSPWLKDLSIAMNHTSTFGQWNKFEDFFNDIDLGMQNEWTTLPQWNLATSRKPIPIKDLLTIDHCNYWENYHETRELSYLTALAYLLEKSFGKSASNQPCQGKESPPDTSRKTTSFSPISTSDSQFQTDFSPKSQENVSAADLSLEFTQQRSVLISQIAQVLTKGNLSSDPPEVPQGESENRSLSSVAILLINTLSAPARHQTATSFGVTPSSSHYSQIDNLDLPHLPSSEVSPENQNFPQVKEEDNIEARNLLLVDLPGWGYQLLLPNQAVESPKHNKKVTQKTPRPVTKSKPNKVWSGRSLANEYFTATFEEKSGLLSSFLPRGRRQNLLSQRLTYFNNRGLAHLFEKNREREMSPFPTSADLSFEEECYTSMVLRKETVLKNTPHSAQIRFEGELSFQEKTIADFTQTFSLNRGSRLLKIEGDLIPKVGLPETHWQNYFASSFAWGQNDFKLFIANSQTQFEACQGDYLYANNYLHLVRADESITLFSGGMPAHRRRTETQLETMLLPAPNGTYRFRLAIGYGLKYPWHSEPLLFRDPLSTKLYGDLNDEVVRRIADRGYFFHLNVANLQFLKWQPLFEETSAEGKGNRKLLGFEVLCQEREGKYTKASLETFLPITEGEKRNLFRQPHGDDRQTVAEKGKLFFHTYPHDLFYLTFFF